MVARGRGRARLRPRAPNAPAPLAAICSLSTGAGSATVEVFGQYLGTGAAADAAIAALLEPGASLSQRTRSYLDAQLVFAGCLGKTTAQCRPASEGGTLGRDTFVAGSAYIAQPFGAAGAKGLVDLIDARQAARGSGVLLFDAQGGAIDDATPAQNSFVHRGLRCSVQILSYEGGSAAGIASARAFVAAARTALEPIGNGQAYQNYPDADLDDLAQRLLRGEVRRPSRPSSTSATPTASCASRRRSGSSSRGRAAPGRG